VVLLFLPPCLRKPQKGTVPLHILSGCLNDDYWRIRGTAESIQPPEVLCRILHFAVGSDGVKALLPFTHVCTRWRNAALGDSSLWTTISLEQMTAPLLDMTLAYSGNRLFTVVVDDPDLERLPMLWKLVDRIEELRYVEHLRQIVPFFSSLGPAPNLRVLSLLPVVSVGRGDTSFLVRSLPVIFAGCLPSLRDLTLTHTVTWPTGLFKGLTSFDCSTPDLSLDHVLDVLRGSPSIEVLVLDGSCDIPPGFNPPTFVFRSLRECSLIGEGTTSLIRFMTVPASARVFLDKPYADGGFFSQSFEDLSAAPGLHILKEISTVSFTISDWAVRVRATNGSGGVLGVGVEFDELLESATLAPFLLSFFRCAGTCPGFKTTKELELDIDHRMIWSIEQATCSALDVLGFVSNLPDVEGVKLRGIPLPELTSITGCLCGVPNVEMPCPNLKRLRIESTLLRSPRPLLLELDKLLAERKKAGRPFQSLTVKMECEMLIPAADHCAFLASWEGLVEGDVWLEYERPKVEKLPRYYHEKEDEEGGRKEAGAGDPDPLCVGWDGWPGQWPKTMGEMRGVEGGEHKLTERACLGRSNMHSDS